MQMTAEEYALELGYLLQRYVFVVAKTVFQDAGCFSRADYSIVPGFGCSEVEAYVNRHFQNFRFFVSPEIVDKFEFCYPPGTSFRAEIERICKVLSNIGEALPAMSSPEVVRLNERINEELGRAIQIWAEEGKHHSHDPRSVNPFVLDKWVGDMTPLLGNIWSAHTGQPWVSDGTADPGGKIVPLPNAGLGALLTPHPAVERVPPIGGTLVDTPQEQGEHGAKPDTSKLTALEEKILEKLGNDTLKGEELAGRCGRRYDGHFKGTLRSLRLRGILGNKNPGYFLRKKKS